MISPDTISPTEYADPASTEPREQPVAGTGEQGNHHSVSEVANELEVQSYIDAEISRRRRQIDQAIRHRTVRQLLESARARPEQEHLLAEQEVEGALRLEPDNPDALGLQAFIEDRRSERQIDESLRLAVRHLDNFAFGHARQVLQSVLQQHANESRALDLLAELERREQAYVRELHEKEQCYQAAVDACSKGDFSSALSKLERVIELDRRAPNPSAIGRSAAYRNLYNRVRSECDTIRNADDEPRVPLASVAVPPSTAHTEPRSAPVPAVEEVAPAAPPVPEEPGPVAEVVSSPATEEVAPAAPPVPEEPSPVAGVVSLPAVETPAARPPLSATPGEPGTVSPARIAARRKPHPLWVAGASAVVVIGAIVSVIVVTGARSPVLPPPVAVEVRTTPPGAAIRVNNEARGLTNARLELPPGIYRLEIALEGYQPVTQSLLVTPDSLPSVELTLEPVAVALRLFTDLERGAVQLDDQPSGEIQGGQFVIEKLGLGKHTLKVSDGRSESVLAFELTPTGLPTIIRPIVAKESVAIVVSNAGQKARVLTSLGPTTVTLNGQPAGETTAEGLLIENLIPGRHELTLGEGKGLRKVMLNAEPAPALTVFLNSDRNVGTLVVVTGEDDVMVFLNGEEQKLKTQRGELRLLNLEVREHSIRVAKEGFVEEPEQRAQVRKGEETSVVFGLKTFPTLQLQGATAGAQVLVGRNPIGMVQPDGAFSARLAPGEHVIELRKEHFKPKRIQRNFAPGETVRLGGAEVTLDSVFGTLKLAVVPPGAQVTLSRPGEAPRAVTETALTLLEGSYTLTARAPGYIERTVNTEVSAGMTRTLELALAREKVAPPPVVAKDPMADWENPAGWVRNGQWLVHTGGEFVPFRTPPSGTLQFTALLQKGRRLQWALRYQDARNYVFFQLDKKTFQRKALVNGKTLDLAKKDHGVKQGDSLVVTVQIEVSSSGIIHRVRNGNQWVVVDHWTEPAAGVANGKFGFVIPGRDQVGLADFHYAAR